jgi:hypothetical protein
MKVFLFYYLLLKHLQGKGVLQGVGVKGNSHGIGRGGVSIKDNASRATKA